MRLMRIPISITAGMVMLPPLLLGRPAAGLSGPDQRAIAQLARELRRPAVVAYLSLQPGYEDAAGLAGLRFDEGAQVVVAYVTNGESSPSDIGDRAPNVVAGRRKEEASRACDIIGATPIFLNLADPGVVPDRDRLAAIWSQDTLSARIVRLLVRYKPDLIIVGSDHRGNQPRSSRATFLAEQVLTAVRRASALPDTGQARRWAVSRVVAESGPGTSPRRLSSMASEMGNALLSAYESMHLQVGPRPDGKEPVYEPMFPEGPAGSPKLLDGLPVLGPVARTFAPVINSLAGIPKKPIDKPSRKALRRAIDTLDVLLGRERALMSTGDLRILASWKNTLEQLRCLLMGVRVDYSVDDLNVSRSSLVYMKIGEVGPDGDSASTRIFFPLARDHEWGINESPDSQFPLSSGREFRVLTPHNLEYNFPSSTYGLDRASLATRFSFIVIHRGRTADGDYILKKDIQFRATPRRSLEVATPVIRADSGQRLIVRMINSNRDAYSGVLTVGDSLFQPASVKVDLKLRNEVRFDTLIVTPTMPLAEGDYRSSVSISGGSAYPFVARKFDAVAAPGVRIGVLTACEGSPLVAGLERLKANWTYLNLGRPDPRGWKGCDVIIVDRDAFSGVREPSAWRAALQSWVRGGGHCVVMAPTRGGGITEGAAPLSFVQNAGIAPWAQLEVDSASALVSSPNRVRPGDWGGWVVARGLSHISCEPAAGVKTLVRSEADGLVLAAEVNDAKGTWTLVSLDLSSQLMNVHPGVHRMLGNLLQPDGPGASKP
jgi:LmbE family N-acetylglucosaminyl deacetylase